MINIKENEQLNVLNHSCAHLLAQAVKRLYPDALFWVGPVTTDGFYYDIDLGEEVIKEEDFAKIEREMKKISKDGKRITRIELSKEEAIDKFSNDPYKIDLINNMPEDEVITCYQQGEFVDLCRGPHMETVKQIKHYKLLKVSGAYFKGDSKNKMLQRIYGVCFETAEDLENHLYLIEEAKKRDHKKLGRELGLFMMSEYAPGMPFMLPAGMILRNELENYWYKEHAKEGYQFVKTPIMMSKELWEVSGHWGNYKENMYITDVDDREYAIKPMNCPGGMLIFKNNLYSYKNLPLRMGEIGQVHRHEASGALNGLFRVRTFNQDDAHIFMTPDQIESEVVRLMKFIDRVYTMLGLTYNIELSTRPLDKYIGDIKTWDKSEEALAKACKAAGRDYKINPGDGAFYGPKLDFHIKDSLGRVWQCGTIQLDMNLPERFDLNYIDSDGGKSRPVMLHRVIFGSIERFMGILIEHFAGAFPTWLAPTQVNIIPVNNDYHLEYANELFKVLEENDIRVKLDERGEKLGYKMRESQTMKIPYTLVIGNNERDEKLITYRVHGSEKSNTVTIDEFIKLIKKDITDKQLNRN